MNLRDTETVGLVKAASKRKRKTKRAPERRGFASTGTAAGNAEPPQPLVETSVVLESRRPQHRLVSIREARLIALEVVHRANRRRQAFAEREALEFASLFGETEG